MLVIPTLEESRLLVIPTLEESRLLVIPTLEQSRLTALDSSRVGMTTGKEFSGHCEAEVSTPVSFYLTQ